MAKYDAQSGKIRSPKRAKALVCRICRFPQCKYRILNYKCNVIEDRVEKRCAESVVANWYELAS